MSVESTLARVEADLAAGYRPLAKQRLRSLVATAPHRLDLRERLAALYREDGEAAQAGRWSYLSAQLREDELAAFQRAYADPERRMHAMAWRGPEDAAGPLVAQRLRELRELAGAAAGRDVTYESAVADPVRVPRDAWNVLFPVLGAVVLLVLLAGAVDVVVRGVHVVAGWFG